MLTSASSVISEEDIVDELRAAWAEVSRGYARCWAAMAEVARRTTSGWESAEVAAALTFSTRRADYELGCAQALVDRLPRVHAALSAGELDHHKARVFTDYLCDLTPAQATGSANGWSRWRRAGPPASWPRGCCGRYRPLIPITPAAPTSVPCASALCTATSTTPAPPCCPAPGLPAPDAAAAAARLEVLADDLRAAGYPATVGQARADLYLRLLDGTLDGLTRAQILATMLRLGPVAPADIDPNAQPGQQRNRGERDHQPPEREAPEQTAPAKGPDQPERAQQPSTGCPGETGTSRPVKYGIEVRVRLSTLLGLDEHPAEQPRGVPFPPRPRGIWSPLSTRVNGVSRSSTPRDICSTVISPAAALAVRARAVIASGGSWRLPSRCRCSITFPRWRPTTPSGPGSCTASPAAGSTASPPAPPWTGTPTGASPTPRYAGTSKCETGTASASDAGAVPPPTWTTPRPRPRRADHYHQ
jgi:hypothetical protein